MGATLGATGTNDILIRWTCPDSRQGRVRVPDFSEHGRTTTRESTDQMAAAV
jgi:hypothetical protein